MRHPLLVYTAFLFVLLSCTPVPETPPSRRAETLNSQAEPAPSPLPEVEADPVRPPEVQAELDEIRKALDSISLDLGCAVDENCVTLGADDNACGIPTDWLIFSTQAPRYIEVKKLLERSFYLDNTYPNSRHQNCGGPSKPKLLCSEGICKKAPLDP